MPRVRRSGTPQAASRGARVFVRATPALARRCYHLLAAGGDVWAAIIELNEHRFRRGSPPLLDH